MEESKLPNTVIGARQAVSEGGNKNSFRALLWLLLLCVFLGGEGSLIARGILHEFDSLLIAGIVLIGVIDGCLAWVVTQKILASKNHPPIPMITADLEPTTELDQTLIQPLLQENTTMAEQAKEKNIFPQSPNSPIETLVPPQTDFSWMEEDGKSLHRANKTTEPSIRELFAYALATQAQIIQLLEALSSPSNEQDLSAQVMPLKQTFRHTCQQFFLQLHPDKYRNTSLEQSATELFVIAQQAYVAVGEELNKAGSYPKEWLRRKISEIGLACSKTLEQYPKLSKEEHEAVQLQLKEAQAFFQRFLPKEEPKTFDEDDSSKRYADITKMYRNHPSAQQREQWNRWAKDLEERARAAYEERLALVQQIKETYQAHISDAETLHIKHLENSRQQNQAYVQEFKDQTQSYVQELKERSQVHVQEFKDQTQSYVQELKERSQVYVQEFKDQTQSYVQELKEQSQVYVQELKQQNQAHVQSLKKQFKIQLQEQKERYIKKFQALNDQTKQLSNEMENGFQKKMDEVFQKQKNGLLDEIMGMLATPMLGTLPLSVGTTPIDIPISPNTTSLLNSFGSFAHSSSSASTASTASTMTTPTSVEPTITPASEITADEDSQDTTDPSATVSTSQTFV